MRLDAETCHALVNAQVDAWLLLVASLSLAFLVARRGALALLLQAVRVILLAKLARLIRFIRACVVLRSALVTSLLAWSRAPISAWHGL